MPPYGCFDDPRREYVITDPRTPAKWINYIGTRAFGGFVDHTGGALICKDDPTFNRITKYIQQMPNGEFKGETLYLRALIPNPSPEGRREQSPSPLGGGARGEGVYRVISPFFVPGLEPLDRYECRVGLGYTKITSEMGGIRCEVTIFVPNGENREIRDIRVTNISDKPLTIDAIPVVEYTHPDALKQFTNADWIPQTMQSRAVVENGLTTLIQYPFMFRDTKVNYLTANLPASSFETDRKKFLGDNEYGSWRTPLSLLAAELSNTQAERGDNIAALLIPLGTLEPGQTQRLITQLGQEASYQAAKPGLERFRQPQSVDSALAELSAFWDEYLSALQVETPDAAMNAMLNVHNPHQCYTTKQWSRYLSYYQLGLGARGIGIRDSSQDILAVLASIPDEGKDFIRTLLTFQRRDGSAYHQFNPATMEGSEGDALEMEDRYHYYSDDHLWSVLTVTAYVKETGDTAFLQQVVPFYDRDKKGAALESASVLEHLKRALAFTRKDVGAHGLPLLGFADWNDTINLPKGAESLFTAHLYGRGLLEMIELLEFLGDTSAADEFRAAHAEMKAKVEENAWDGDWYVMYFDQEGQPVGSHKNQYGQIHLNGQSWAVLSGFAAPERAQKAMESVYQRLNTKYGLKLSTPGYNGFDPKYGGITTYPPGAKENGGIFLHPNPWAMMAETMLGHGDRAFEYYAQINPAAKNDALDLYEIEPYVYAQNILADEHPLFGLGRNSWLSGTASWTYQAGTQWILGIRAEYGGLRVDPCIPPAWSGFKTVRKFRGGVYRLEVHNSRKSRDKEKGVSKSIARMTVDGQEVAGNLIPLLGSGEHHIEVWMG